MQCQMLPDKPDGSLHEMESSVHPSCPCQYEPAKQVQHTAISLKLSLSYVMFLHREFALGHDHCH